MRTLIDGQRQLRPEGKVLAPGGSSADLHVDQIRAGQASSYSAVAPTEAPAMPRTSEGAVSIEAKLQKSLDVQPASGHRTGLTHGALPGIVTAVPHVTITTHSSTAKQGESNCPKQSFVSILTDHLTTPAGLSTEDGLQRNTRKFPFCNSLPSLC